jgi:hypothetical protein
MISNMETIGYMIVSNSEFNSVVTGAVLAPIWSVNDGGVAVTVKVQTKN